MTTPTELIDYLLLLGDSTLVQGQRLCEWCGKAPAIEEELALMNVGLDLVGQARNWLDYAAELLGDGRDADDLAFRRDERAYRNLLLVEQPNGDFAVTMAKQFLFDAWHLQVLKGLCESSDARIAGIAAKALKEVTYHLRRSSEWVQRLGGGTDESRQRMLAAIAQVWRFSVELATGSEAETALYGSVLSDLTDAMEVAVRAELAQKFAEAVDAPIQLIRRLANDEAEDVAEPVLRASPMLTEADLVPTK